MSSFIPAVAEEWKNTLFRAGIGRAGGFRSILINLMVSVIFGILIPWYKGFDFLDPVMVSAYAFLSLLFVTPATSEAMAAGDRVQSWTRLMAKLFAAALYGWAISVVILLLGLITVNAANWLGYPVVPDRQLLLAVLFASLLGSIFVASAGGAAAILFSAPTAKTILRFGFLGVLLLFLLLTRFGPEAWQAAFTKQLTDSGIIRLALIASAVFAILDIALMAVLRAPFQRA